MYLFSRSSEICSHLEKISGAGSFPQITVLTWCSSRLWTVFSGNLQSCLKEVKTIVVFDVERGMALEAMQGNRVSSLVDLGYPELFPSPTVTSVFF